MITVDCSSAEIEQAKKDAELMRQRQADYVLLACEGGRRLSVTTIAAENSWGLRAIAKEPIPGGCCGL
jgi:hypothetical protein